MIRILLPILILLGGAASALALISGGSEKKPKRQEAPQPPGVKVLRVRPETVWLPVRSQGIVTPRTEIDLVAEVAGKIVRVHPAFVAGGAFKRGEVLAAIDPRDYDYAVVRARSRLAEAERQLAQEAAQAEQARQEWRVLGEGEPTPLALHEPQLAEMRAKVAAAEANLAEAKLRRARCELKAPFDGRIRAKQVDAGQYVSPGDKLARIYADDSAEVRLPVSLDQLAYLPSLPAAGEGESNRPLPAVTLTAAIGGKSYRWEGRVVRTESALDPATGLLYAVARIPRPFSRGERPPLLPGTFVEAKIEGRALNDVFVLPPGAVNATRQAMLVDAANRLRIRRLQVLKNNPDRIVVGGGLQPGDRVVVAGIDVPVEGMEVKVQ
ncbi:MAG: efflux RND transporter periplasmic adaptor subunit [Methylohalobius sp. ZOD2]|nr:efflux RND transporter periplasmic adaptor subunit [Methylothermaceae bacterium]